MAERSRPLNLRTLLALALCTTSVAVVFQEPLVQLVLVLFTVALFPFSGGKGALRRLSHRLRSLLFVVLSMFVFQVLFRHEGTVLWSWGILQVTTGGLGMAVAISLRLLLILLLAGLLFGVPFSEFLLAFRAWRIPYEIAFLVTTTIHFLPQFDRRFKLVREALLQRGVRLDKLPLAQRPRAYVSLLLPVLGQALHDVRRRAEALELRAFRLHPTRTWRASSRLRLRDWFIQSAALLVTVGYIVGRLLAHK
ncbi:MAG: energy-coupling factor transporter transmembrane protein EcfT [Candidatus Cloacimonetes bacterium]|nr:energy-coupling factor transporter transmembrane protein EcfT [Candidatus Cloacimonadota bacterium]